MVVDSLHQLKSPSSLGRQTEAVGFIGIVYQDFQGIRGGGARFLLPGKQKSYCGIFHIEPLDAEELF